MVVDVTSVRTTSGRTSVDFFTRSAQHLHAAEQAAGVSHHVALSIVGIDGETSGYYAGKVAQEQRVQGGPVPWTLLRAPQFHEFVPQIVARTSLGPFAVVPAMRTSTVAAAEVAEALVRLAGGPPHGRATDLGGPGEDDLADLVRRWLAGTGRRSRVLRLPLPGSSGRRMRDGALLPGPDADHGVQTFSGSSTSADPGGRVPSVDLKLELVPIPVADVDRAKAFYADGVGCHVDVDVQPADGIRVVQVTPPGSACSIGFGTGLPVYQAAPGSVRGLHLVVADIEAARAALVGRGVEVGPVTDVGGGVLYAGFEDPDGNSLTLQQLPWRTGDAF